MKLPRTNFIFTRALALCLSLAMLVSSASFGQAQTIPAPAQMSQSPVGTDASVAMERGNPQRTGVYTATGAPTVGNITWSSRKLFDIEVRERPRGKLESDFTIEGRTYYLRGDHIDRAYNGFDYCEPVVAGGTLYFVMNYVKRESQLFSVDTRTGEAKLFSKRSNGWYSAPAVAGDTLYVGADSGLFYAVDLKTGGEKWRHVRGDDSYVVQSPVVAGGMVFYTSSHGGLYALDAEKGKSLWVFSTRSYITPPAVADETIYFSDHRNIYALDARTGKERWRFNTTKEGSSSIVVSNGVLYFREVKDGHIQRLDAATGAALPKPKKVNQSATRLAVEGQTVYFGGWDSGSIFAADAASGELRWKFTATAEIHCKAPVVAGDNLYTTCDDGRLYALDKETGKRRWSSDQRTADLSAPVVADGMIFFISDNGKVYAVR